MTAQLTLDALLPDAPAPCGCTAGRPCPEGRRLSRAAWQAAYAYVTEDWTPERERAFEAARAAYAVHVGEETER